MSGITDGDFLDLGYQPRSSDLCCEFYVEPAADLDAESAASRLASESSNGTWTALPVDGDVRDLSATAFDVEDAIEVDPESAIEADIEAAIEAGPVDDAPAREGYRVSVAYPHDLFENGNMPQVLSCIAGNVLGLKAFERIRLADCTWPEPLATSFPGPQYGTDVRKVVFDVGDRPITATAPKPKVGLSTEQHTAVGSEAWIGGVDLVKDDENLTDQPFNPFEDRLSETLAERDRAEEATGERKSYVPNVTAAGDEMLERVDLAAEHGCEFVMVDVVTCGWASLQQVRERCDRLGLAIHAHRTMHAAFDRQPGHGVSMRVLAQIARLCGVDQLHTGTADLGTLANEDTAGVNEWLASPLYGLNDVLPMASGGLHPGLVPELIERCGTTVAIQAGGGIHGHPDGTRAGARAMRAAVDAASEGRVIDAAAEDEPALATALDTWGASTPR